MKEGKSYTVDEARALIQRYCSYRDRSHFEVVNKLKDYGMQTLALETILVELIADKFLDEERFAKAYARGKFTQNKWGWRKILQGLKHHQISEYCIRKAHSELMELPYYEVLEGLMKKKWTQTPSSSLFEKRQKVASYLLSKGFESNNIWELLSDYEAE